MAKVLIIDDNQDDVNSISATLNKFIPGCVVSHTQSVDEGVRRAQANPPDVILLNIALAETDDFEMCKQLRAEGRTKNSPVIMLTNRETGAKSRAKALEAGGAGFLGSHLCERLVEAGHDVICLDNFFTSQKTNVAHLLDRPNFELIRHDITIPIWLEVDLIYNLACPAAPGHYQHNPIKL